jgi:oligopeptide/dipeptide ABC transporter ATP-binding protein
MTETQTDSHGQADNVLLDIRGLVKQFPIRGSEQKVHACSDVTLTVHRGETLGVIGESGSGKTTLGRCVLGLIEPTSGEVIFEGRDVAKLPGSEVRKLRTDMQIVFQEPFDSLNPQITIARQITEPLRIHRGLRGKKERNAKAVELLRLVGLPPTVADAVPAMLAPGALQRCSIARAIATEPKLIVLDEPTSSLPPGAEADVIALLKSLQVRLGLTYIFISHDLSLVQSISDRVAVMYLSQVVELGEREEIFRHPRHPYTRALLASVLLPDPKQRHGLSDRAERVEGEIPSPVDLPRGCYLATRCPYVRDRCREERQELRQVGQAHWARCWRMSEGDLTEEEIAGTRRRRGEARLADTGLVHEPVAESA